MKRIVNGLLVLDKPTGMTSRNAIDRALEWFPRRTKIGHTGTLDPLATGVLVICLGSATRLAEYVQAMDKIYRTKIVLGGRSDTDDADGTITPTEGVSSVAESVLRETLTQFVGEIAQTPPAYSAVKIDGKRAHDLARRGRDVEISPRPVNVYSITLLGYAWPELDLEIHCGKGTYIRSLARDLGEKLGCGAYVQELRRTRVGPFTVESAANLDHTMDAAINRLLPLKSAVMHLPEVVTNETEADILRHGQPITLCEGSMFVADSEVALLDGRGEMMGIGIVKKDGKLWPVKTFAGE